MSCIELKPAWYNQGLNKNGKRDITFQRRGTQLNPDLYIPCGKCLECTKVKSRDWGIRILHESQYHDRNCFLTLTYENAPEHISKPDIQHFLARLRHETGPIRYYITGEYGPKTNRPHYHAILFGEDFLGGARILNDNNDYTNRLLESTWTHGFVQAAMLTPERAMYCAGYVTKKLDDKNTFTLMSRNPPLGYQWAVDHQDNVAQRESVVINGKELPIPAQYFKWLDTNKKRLHTVDLEEAKQNKQAKANEQEITMEKLHKKHVARNADRRWQYNSKDHKI